METLIRAVHTRHNWQEVFEDPLFRDAFIEEWVPQYITKRRWFAGKSTPVKVFKIERILPLPTDFGYYYHIIVEVVYEPGYTETYLLPLSFVTILPKEDDIKILGKCVIEGTEGFLVEAVYLEDYRNALFNHMIKSSKIGIGADNFFLFERGKVMTENEGDKISSELLNVEQSNTSIIYNNKYILKIYRKLFMDHNPDHELVRFLSDQAGFTHSPKYGGSVSWVRSGNFMVSIALMTELIPNQGEGWDYMLKKIESAFDNFLNSDLKISELPKLKYLRKMKASSIPDQYSVLIGEEFLDNIEMLAKRTAQMHVALASNKIDRHFVPRSYNSDFSVWLKNRLIYIFENRYNMLESNLHKLEGDGLEYAHEFISHKSDIIKHFLSFDELKLNSKRIRIHGDYHLGQVLLADNDFFILDYEGEPESTIRDRKVKQSPLKDVAGIFRSFHYAIYATLFKKKKYQDSQNECSLLGSKLFRVITNVFLDKYCRVAFKNNLDIGYSQEIKYLLKYHLLEKAVYELGYELNARPDWAIIPLKGIMQILNVEENEK
ncbi:maltokinase N-terminal cap-like domain-containing protein [Marinigracilibium pacificum]|uniref:Maltokinase n=1 Tax=Marinigracilibium pacificum TaxID=2729599 RepID=A0A848J1I6_9BACT|nr:trehalose synthase [Marinigracilibium pacificum]NMM48169.1 trehalose synthase [Marinigracilibium pacificum]